jgi:copper chaperone
MSTVVIGIVLLLLVLLGVKSSAGRFAHGCCGTGGDKVDRIKVEDRNKKNYPLEKDIQVDGMTCRNCALRVENALTGLNGVYAKVNLEKKEAVVLMKKDVEDGILREKIREAGYWVLSVRQAGKSMA